jgi:L-asparaginase II
MMAALITKLLPMEAAEAAKFDRFLHPVMKNCNGITVGSLRPTFS